METSPDNDQKARDILEVIGATSIIPGYSSNWGNVYEFNCIDGYNHRLAVSVILSNFRELSATNFRCINPSWCGK
jgi:hypothetical protein